jgi:hypothetical protein
LTTTMAEVVGRGAAVVTNVLSSLTSGSRKPKKRSR